jgi:hypothetical protein
MGYTAAGYADGGSYVFHFPDGNASIEQASTHVRARTDAGTPPRAYTISTVSADAGSPRCRTRTTVALSRMRTGACARSSRA